MTMTRPVSAGEDRIDLASADKGHSRQIKQISAVPVVNEKYEYYEVRGNNEKDLRCQMTDHGCRWSDGRKYDSVTSWYVTWDYGYNRTPQGCSAESFKAIVDITFRFPKWVRSDEAPQAMTDKWDAYMKNLVAHENGHRDMAVAAAADLYREVSSLRPAPSCAEIDRKVKMLCRERIEQMNQDQKEYDATTVHGATQGAKFP
jgi:predicted secreted Zn-dependent protease